MIMDVNKVNMVKYKIGLAMTKFDILDKLFEDVKIKQNEVVWHFDMNAVLCRCYQEEFASQLDRADQDWTVMSMVISMLNVLAHYRKYTVFKLHKKNTIIVTYNSKLTAFEETVYPEYYADRVTYWSEDHPIYGDMNQMLHKAYDMMASICRFIDDIFVIDLDPGVDSVTLMGLLRNDDRWRKSYHILYTRNLSATQLVNKNTSILYAQIDHSSLITLDNCLSDGILRDCGDNFRKKYQRKLSPIMIPFIATLGGCKHLLKPSKFCPGKERRSITYATELIMELLKDSWISPSISIQSFVEVLEKYFKQNPDKNGPYTEDDYEELIGRYQAFTVPVKAVSVTKKTLIKIYKQVFNMYNQEYLEEVNELIASFGTDAQLIEFTVLNINEPSKTEYEGEW